MSRGIGKAILVVTALLMGGIGYQFTQPKPAQAAECFTYCGGLSCRPTGLERACSDEPVGCSNSMCGA